MGAHSADSPKKYVYTPETLHLEAGRFVTIKLTNPSLQSHTFTIDSLDCDSGLVPPGGSVMVSFNVPSGTTPFYCRPHAQVPMNGEIVTG